MIRVEKLIKDYRVYPGPTARLLEAMPFARKKRHTLRRALDGVSFEVGGGECLGVIGANGSGKSTLLKILAGTTSPTTGKVELHGAVSYILDPTAGFNFDFSAHANIYTKCALLGLDRDQTAELYDSIVDFSGLRDRIEDPLRTYSTGMVLRLGFAIVIHVDFDVLLIDEVLSVGDLVFQTKCVTMIRQFRKAGKTIVVASHAMGEISEFSDRVLYLRQGQVHRLGTAEDVIREYTEDYERRKATIDLSESERRLLRGSFDPGGTIRMAQVSLLDEQGNPIEELEPGDPLLVQIIWEAAKPIHNPCFRVQVYGAAGLFLSGTNTYRHEIDLGTLEGRGTVVCRFPQFPFLEGEYFINVGIWPDEFRSFNTRKPYDLHELMHTVRVRSSRRHGGGTVYAPTSWEVKDD
ncbi:MAG: ABC transporter ATP-binding protein [Candidatus Alcyoniella australis]|nr:ABC transporter ATP-binding protein [Candidatus Alcyoniella australis]